MAEQKIKSDNYISIGKNIRAIRLVKKIGQTQLVQILQLNGFPLTRQALVKIERGIQHISASQLYGIKEALNTTYDELLKPL
jgi:transcriptional regulator with XRE-family HTH domain